MISIFDMSNRLVEHGINVKLSHEPDQSVWVIHAQKGDDSGDWTVPTDDVEMCSLARDMIRTMIINKILVRPHRQPAHLHYGGRAGEISALYGT